MADTFIGYFTINYMTREDGRLLVNSKCRRPIEDCKACSGNGGYDETFDPDPELENSSYYSVRCKLCGNVEGVIFSRNESGNWKCSPE